VIALNNDVHQCKGHIFYRPFGEKGIRSSLRAMLLDAIDFFEKILVS